METTQKKNETFLRDNKDPEEDKVFIVVTEDYFGGPVKIFEKKEDADKYVNTLTNSNEDIETMILSMKIEKSFN